MDEKSFDELLAAGAELPAEEPALPEEIAAPEEIVVPDAHVGPPPKKNPTLKIIAVSLAAVLLLGLGGWLAMPAILRAVSPKNYLKFVFENAMKDLGINRATAAQIRAPARHRLDLTIVNQITAIGSGVTSDTRLPDTHISAALELDYKNRKAALEAAMDQGGPPTGLDLFLDGSALSFGSETLTRGKYYSVNTETLGADMAVSPLFPYELSEEVKTLSFNLFDELDRRTKSPLSRETTALLAELTDDFTKTVTVTKGEAEKVESLAVGYDVQGYLVVFPAAPLREYLKQCVQVLAEDEGFTLPGTDRAAWRASFEAEIDKIKQDPSLYFHIAGDKLVRVQGTFAPYEKGSSAPSRYLFLDLQLGPGAFQTDLYVTRKNEPERQRAFSMRGTLTATGQEVTLDLPEIAFNGSRAFSLRYQIAALSGGFTKPFPTDPAAFLKLTQAELTQVFAEYVKAANG